MKGKFLIAGALAALLLPASAQAHRQWMLPSSTVLSGDESWVTVDAAVSNDLFYFEHQPMRTDNVKASAPDGSEVAIENAATGRYRSTFDVHLTKQGTYRIASVSQGVIGTYTLNGKQERVPRGTTKENLAKAIPAGATDVRTTETSNRNEVFVTLGAPTDGLFKPTGVGLELAPITHPNDLVAGEAASFRFLLDGKPATDLKVTVIPGGIRYRDDLGQMDLTTDKDGKITITWPEPGLYWLNASIGGAREGGPDGAGAAAQPSRRASYVTTLEILAP